MILRLMRMKNRKPTKPEFQMQPDVFRMVILERIRLPLDVTTSRCECGGSVDTLGPPCCMLQVWETPRQGSRSGVARVCREAGAVVRRNVKLRDMNSTVPVHDA